MPFIEKTFYHIYNRGNNKQKIFFSEANYIYFLNKIKKHIKPHCEILAYCLMPNHFHILISTKSNINTNELSNGLRIALSSYTRGVNKELNRTGSLFQQNTKRKLIRTNDGGKYLKKVFDYIHLNPIASNLTKELSRWSFSSFKEYYLKKKVSTISYICNTKFASKYIEWMNLELHLVDQLKIYFYKYV